MGSANGRHRRPRQAPAIVVAAGVTGSAIAIPLLGATGAHAAEASTWDRVAECESGGMWSADLGNGYYGGLQFSQDDWSAYGGTAYAARADLASRSQQISVAEKVLDDKGPQAWPSCAVISGLALDGTLPGVDPGGDPSADPTATEAPSDAASTETPDKVDEKSKSDKKGKSGKGDASTGSAASESSSPSATPSPEASTGTDLKGEREAGRHASRGDSEAREGAAAVADGTYTVREGDNLWAIADEQKLPGGWSGLYEANKAELGSDPDLILPGQSLDLAPKADADTAAADEESGAEAAVAN
ncbi:Resuscitation-promoting factor RpfA precursor [Streptomyces sp. ADI97-07]|uniref:LysM peptidoglycan-binding domain-containing protein n=1 Tax=Streptomyces sp. ADI97-07 TaxID=1522762 RepID=UPI000F54D3D5|nr:transglycosylase family protein [Streptomyces sp. ADI97-07]RPK77494.1 Resuscitation-promoting factor RpfA precursor [Streptomyces sp. ADI97-07]